MHAPLRLWHRYRELGLQVDFCRIRLSNRSIPGTRGLKVKGVQQFVIYFDISVRSCTLHPHCVWNPEQPKIKPSETSGHGPKDVGHTCWRSCQIVRWILAVQQDVFHGFWCTVTADTLCSGHVVGYQTKSPIRSAPCNDFKKICTGRLISGARIFQSWTSVSNRLFTSSRVTRTRFKLTHTLSDRGG